MPTSTYEAGRTDGMNGPPLMKAIILSVLTASYGRGSLRVLLHYAEHGKHNINADMVRPSD